MDKVETMTFQKPMQASIPELESLVRKFWDEKKIFDKTLEASKGHPRWVFYEGPPTANGRPHPGHILTRVIKDLFPRYKTMTGHFVERKAGWDTHGLPVEIEVEKALGLNSKGDIEKYGVEKFIGECKKSVWKYLADWEDITRQIGFWIDLDNPYVTYRNEYIESLWWIFKQIHRAGLLVRGHKTVPFCNRCGTPLSSHEVAQGYVDVTEPSVFVLFQSVDDNDTYFLAWTTTPWTLLSNLALAMGPEYEYITYQYKDKKYILAKSLARDVFGDRYDTANIIDEKSGKDFEGKKYVPLYPFEKYLENNYRVIMADFVSLEDGSGIVHIAPGYGEDDYLSGRANDLDMLQVAGESGFVSDDAPEMVAGKYFKEADEPILLDLKDRCLLFKVKEYTHAYPHCWRCKSPLMYFARESWFLKTTEIRNTLVEENRKIEWYPETIKEGRFGKFLENNIDWAISRNRYWGTPLPIWVCDGCNHNDVVGSIAELKERANENVPDDVELHRPGIDQYTLKCSECGGTMHRVPEVADTWFDSGSMPVAQWHYPFEFREEFIPWYPCDFISEAQDQTRGWFYTLHAVAGLLHAASKKFPDDEDLKPFRDWGLSYKRCICLGLILDDDGLKMSKSRGGYIEPTQILQNQGADALRWNFYGNVDPWVGVRFTEESVRDVQRRFLLTLRNVYQFFTIYANIDGYDPLEVKDNPDDYSPLDKWILAKLNHTIKDVRFALDHYDVLSSAKALESFVDALSNWYVRRSRERFWRADKDTDKWAAYSVLFNCLVTLSKALAPFTPFISEEIYQNLGVGHLSDAKESVHLESYPGVEEKWLNDELEQEVALAMEIAKLGRSARKESKIRVRQPLSELIVVTDNPAHKTWAENQKDVILDELNIKALTFTGNQSDFVKYTITPNFSLLGPRFGRDMPLVKSAFGNLTDDQAKAIQTSLESGKTCTVDINGKSTTFTDEEVSVTMDSKEGYAAASGSTLAIVLKTELTGDLLSEGIAREIIHHVQGLRKTADLDYTAKIDAYIGTDNREVLDAVGQHEDYIRRETLANELKLESSDGLEHRADAKVDGVPVAFGLKVI